MRLLFFKARARGDKATADMFGTPTTVQVKGYTKKDGTYVEPHQAKRKKKPKVKKKESGQLSLLFGGKVDGALQKERQVKPESLSSKTDPRSVEFTPTHALGDGTKVVAVEDEQDVWIDAYGEEFEEEDVSPIKKQKSKQASVFSNTDKFQNPEHNKAKKPGNVANTSSKVSLSYQSGAVKRADRKEANVRAKELLAKRGTLTDDELTELALYSGRGGIGDSMNEYYTRPDIAKSMWETMYTLGYDGGLVLEPSCGTGVYLDQAPAGTKVVGVELDKTSSSIAKHLHGDNHEVVNSTLEAFATDDPRQFSAVIGNVPFGLRGSFIKDDKPYLNSAEQYFVDTAIDKVKPGGIVSLIVPTGIMDSKNGRAFRENVLRKAEFLGARRLPNTAFEHSHTEVTTDVVYFRARPKDVAGALSVATQDQLKELGVWDSDFLGGMYFEANPNHVFGKTEEGWRAKAGMGNDITVSGSMSGVAQSLLASVTSSDESQEITDVQFVLNKLDDGKQLASAKRAMLKQPYDIANVGDTKIVDGITYILQGDPPRWHRADQDEPVHESIADAESIANMVDRLFTDPDGVNRKGLVEGLDEYVAKHGRPADNKDLVREAQHNKSLWRLIGAVNADGSYSDKVMGRSAVDLSSFDAVAAFLAANHEGFTVDEIADNWSGGDREDSLDHLFASDNYAIDPDGKTWMPMDDYLAGDLWERFDKLTEQLEHEGIEKHYLDKFKRQRDALETAIDPKILEDVEFKMNSAWIPIRYLEAFLNNDLDEYKKKNGSSPYAQGIAPVKIGYESSLYSIEGGIYGNDNLLKYLNRTGLRKDDRPAIEEKNDRFKEWAAASEYRDELEDLYNRKFRGYAEKSYSDAAIDIPGLAPDFDVNAYHFSGLRWDLERGKGIIADDVGLGKSGRALMLAKLMKSSGQATKPTFVVPKSVLANWMEEAETWFPGSKVMVIGETYSKDKNGNLKSKSDTKAERAKKYHELSQNSSYDFIFISQPAFNELDLDPITKWDKVKDDFWQQRREALGKSSDKKTAKMKEAYNQAIAKRDFEKRTDEIYFNDIGIDLLISDEFHCFPSGTLVDGRPIEALRVGDMVKSFNHSLSKIEGRKITAIMRRKPSTLCSVFLKSGKEIVCTEDHPFYTDRGYVPAIELTEYDTITHYKQKVIEGLYGGALSRMWRNIFTVKVTKTKSKEWWFSVLLKTMFSSVACKTNDYNWASPIWGLSPVRGAFPVEQNSRLENKNRKGQQGILRPVLCGYVETYSAFNGCGTFKNGYAGESEKSIQHQDEKIQPYVSKRSTGEASRDIEKNRAQATDSGRQRAWSDCSTKDAVGSSWLGGGSGCKDHGKSGERLSDLLQIGYWTSRLVNWGRGRWLVAPGAKKAGTGQKERSVLESVGVDRVEVYQQRGDGGFGSLCPDNYVYDIEVDGNHNFFADGVLVHNCFKNLYAARSRYGEQPKFLGGTGLSNRALDFKYKTDWVREQNGGKGVFGLTATPTKNSPLEIYSMLSHIAPEEFTNIGINNSEDFLDRYVVFRPEQVLTTTGEIAESLITVGFKNMDELRNIMRKYINMRTAESVGLEIPKPDKHDHFLDMTPRQEAVYDELRTEMADSGSDDTGSAHIFSIMSRMGKAAMDLELLDDETYAGEKSPKYNAAADEAFKRSKDGGQIIFVESVDSHQKMVDALVARGADPKEIAIINAKAANTSAKRQNIATKFNKGEFKFVVGNSVMGEGMNLQKLTTDIHHLDTPWDPATLQQRNGRGLRQGNKNSRVGIHSYYAKGSFDGYRYQTVEAKKDWMNELWHGGDRIENLAREGSFSREDLLIMMSADPEKARKDMDNNKAEAAARTKALGVAKVSDDLVRFQSLSRSFEGLENKKSKAALRLRGNIEKLNTRLSSNEFIDVKDIVKNKGKGLLQRDTGHIWTAGKAFTMQPGDGAPVNWSAKPSKWVVTGVDTRKGKVMARTFAGSSTHSFDLAKMNKNIDPFEYSTEAEAKATTKKTVISTVNGVFKSSNVDVDEKVILGAVDVVQGHADSVSEWHKKEQTRAQMEIKIINYLDKHLPESVEREQLQGIAKNIRISAQLSSSGINPDGLKNSSDLVGMSDRAIADVAPALQEHLKDKIRNYKNDQNGPYGMTNKETGEIVAFQSYNGRDNIDTHDLILPTKESKNKVIQAFMKMRESRHFETKFNQTNHQRRNYVSGSPSGISVKYPGWDYGSNTGNPWGRIGKELFGDTFESSAQKAVVSNATHNIGHLSKDLPAAFKHALPALLDSAYGHSLSWPESVINALRKVAKKYDVLDSQMDHVLHISERQYGTPDDLEFNKYLFSHSSGGRLHTSSTSTVASFLDNIGNK